jgi:DNA-binding NarL/FixJ family response regulator
MTTHQPHLATLSDGSHGDLAGLLDMVERGCIRLMKTGGGALTQDGPNRAKPKHPYSYRVTPEQTTLMTRMAASGKSLIQIAREIGVSANTAARHTRKSRTCAVAAPDPEPNYDVPKPLSALENWRRNDEHHQ